MRYKTGEEPKVDDVVYLNVGGGSPLLVVKIKGDNVSVNCPHDDGFTAPAQCFTKLPLLPDASSIVGDCAMCGEKNSAVTALSIRDGAPHIESMCVKCSGIYTDDCQARMNEIARAWYKPA
jgi:hypothetical protein